MFLIIPINWIIILLLIAAFITRKNLRVKTAVAGLILLVLFSNSWLFRSLAHAWEWPPVTLPANKHFSSVIVLGGFISQVNGKEGRFNGSSDRFIQGMRLQLTGKASHILITGGNASVHPDKFSESEWARGQLKQFKFADSTIIIEGKARNTVENEKFSVSLLRQHHLSPPYLLVTSAFHMRRAVMIFKKNGINVTPYPADFHTGPTARFSFINDVIPNFETIVDWNTFIKEWIGYLVNQFVN